VKLELAYFHSKFTHTQQRYIYTLFEFVLFVCDHLSILFVPLAASFQELGKQIEYQSYVNPFNPFNGGSRSNAGDDELYAECSSRE
jgi:hypothetical protein